jgi:hypothetical protein
MRPVNKHCTIIVAEDMQMNSRFMNYPLSVKWTAFIPSVIGLVLFVSLVSLYGRFPAHQVREQACVELKTVLILKLSALSHILCLTFLSLSIKSIV